MIVYYKKIEIIIISNLKNINILVVTIIGWSPTERPFRVQFNCVSITLDTKQFWSPILTVIFDESIPKFWPSIVISVFESETVFGDTPVIVGVYDELVVNVQLSKLHNEFWLLTNTFNK